ncbi:hypothetical protein [Aestuariivirga sp.]|uniref:hypothetical protein n=1 Tax=Aestuariivirga sp. TaxID=2650926 RepID=UPI00391CBC6C
MIRHIALAAAVVLATLAGSSMTAPAQADVKLYFGVPFYPYSPGPGWRYYRGYGWYDYDRYGPFQPYYRDRLTCKEARRLVDRRGYDDVDARDCSGRVYSFRATTRNGKRVTVYVNAYTRAIWR